MEKAEALACPRRRGMNSSSGPPSDLALDPLDLEMEMGRRSSTMWRLRLRGLIRTRVFPVSGQFLVLKLALLVACILLLQLAVMSTGLRLRAEFPFVSVFGRSRYYRTPKIHLLPTEYIGIGVGREMKRTGDPFQKTEGDQRSQDQKSQDQKRVVFHVTKEFGDSQFGGLGSIVTNLAIAQAKQGMSVNVLTPLFSYLADKYRDKMIPVMDITLFVDTSQGLLPLDVTIFKLDYEGVTVYLVGPGNEAPYDGVFHAIDKHNIYSFTDIAPNERDLFFAAAGVKFAVIYHKWVGMTHIQVHGSTNGMFFDFWKAERNQSRMGKQRPAFVYTIHDYAFEVTYSLDFPLVHDFFSRGVLAQEVTQSRMEAANSLFSDGDSYAAVFPASVGVHTADVVTCVSHNLARNIVGGTLNFTMKEIVWDSLVERAKENSFFGIPNGVALSIRDDPMLGYYGLQFDETDPEQSLLYLRRQAKLMLHHHGVLTLEERDSEIALFIGRFEHLKGIDLCFNATKIFADRGVTLVVMGQPSGNEGVADLLISQGSVVIDDQALQDQLGSLVRLAATFMFVPSRTEAFGLVGAEGLMFGSSVISTGVGGMRDFLFESQADILLASEGEDLNAWPQRNAFLFDYSDPTSLREAITACLDDYAKLDALGREDYGRKMMRSVRGLSWLHERGPAHLYTLVYDMASTFRDRNTEKEAQKGVVV